MMTEVKPHPEYDEAIAEMCRWLKQNQKVGLGTRSGKLVILPAEAVYGPEWTPKEQTDI